VRALAWDGIRLLAVDERGKRIVAISPGGDTVVLAAASLQKPTAIAADPAGQFAVLDEKAQEVLLFAPDGTVRDRISAVRSGATRPSAVALAADGSLIVTDASGAKYMRIP
jgi:hypothetical protein